MIRLLLADDHSIVTDGISQLVADQSDIEVVAVCNNGLEALAVLRDQPADVALLDIDMPQLNGIDCATRVLREFPEVKVAMLTMHREKSLIMRFIEMGVNGYFLKTIRKDELIHGIKTIAAGSDYFPSDVTKTLVSKEAVEPTVTQDPRIASLSERELEIIRLISQGMTNNDIAEKLFISPRTADTHRTNIMRKLELHNVASLVAFAFQNKLVS